jgi:hypothetical protein
MPDRPPLGLYLASPCYGGVAQARFLRSLLELRAACARRRIPLRLDLGGGEALTSRGRAAMMATFLGTAASHLVFADCERAFQADLLLERLEASSAPVARLEEGLVLISRTAAEALTLAYPGLAAGLADVAGAGASTATMVFDAIIEPGSRRYLSDWDAFWWRWEQIAGGL